MDASNVARQMDFCLSCGNKTDPDWVFCRSCGSALDEENPIDAAVPLAPAANAPKVELISRGWDEVVDTVEAPADPFHDDEISPGPLPAGAIEFSFDDLSIVETDVVPEDPDIDPERAEVVAEVVEVDKGDPEPEMAAPTDQWDHLRPHGEMPPLQRRVSIAGRVGQSFALLTALAALAAAAIHFYLNTRLDAFGKGRVSAQLVGDIEFIANVSLIVVGGTVLVTLLALASWLIVSRAALDLRPGKSGIVALLALMGTVAVAGVSYAVRQDTVTEAIAANSLMVLSMGLLMATCLAVVRTVERIDRKEPA
jgi:hypothetical protein